jgi:hypothetical protein
MEPRGYVTSIGMSLIQPLLTLVEQLTSWEVASPNAVQTSARENGYAAAIIVLAVTLLADRNFKRTFLPAPPGATPQPRQSVSGEAAVQAAGRRRLGPAGGPGAG